jgi:hypothetical protein
MKPLIVRLARNDPLPDGNKPAAWGLTPARRRDQRLDVGPQALHRRCRSSSARRCRRRMRRSSDRPMAPHPPPPHRETTCRVALICRCSRHRATLAPFCFGHRVVIRYRPVRLAVLSPPAAAVARPSRYTGTAGARGLPDAAVALSPRQELDVGPNVPHAGTPRSQVRPAARHRGDGPLRGPRNRRGRIDGASAACQRTADVIAALSATSTSVASDLLRHAHESEDGIVDDQTGLVLS